MTIYLVPNAQKRAALELVRPVADVLLGAHCVVLLEARFGQFVQGMAGVQLVADADAHKACDIVATIGGDGTMLHTARTTMKTQKPLIGINEGQLGFLTIIESDELDKLRRLPLGEYEVEHRSMLQAHCDGVDTTSCLALNDVVLFKQAPEKTIGLDIFCDETKVSGFRGDGVVFATPTGSTAYSLSAGGPVLDARLGGIIVTQICAHIVHSPPMVFAGNRLLRAVPTEGNEQNIFLSCDGLESVWLPTGRPVTIRQADTTLPVIQFSDAGQLRSIDKKLKGR